MEDEGKSHNSKTENGVDPQKFKKVNEFGSMGRDEETEIRFKNIRQVFPVEEGATVRVRAGHIPYTAKGKSQFLSVPRVIDGLYPVVNNELHVALYHFGEFDAYLIELSLEPEVKTS